jgi:hypothetical protein
MRSRKYLLVVLIAISAVGCSANVPATSPARGAKVLAGAAQAYNLTVDSKAHTLATPLDTGIDVPAGARVSIEAEGTWDHGQNHPSDASGDKSMRNRDNGFPYGALLARLGTGSYFLVGTGYKTKDSSSGRLYLAENDDPDAYENNIGTLSVSIVVTPQ